MLRRRRVDRAPEPGIDVPCRFLPWPIPPSRCARPEPYRRRRKFQRDGHHVERTCTVPSLISRRARLRAAKDRRPGPAPARVSRPRASQTRGRLREALSVKRHFLDRQRALVGHTFDRRKPLDQYTFLQAPLPALNRVPAFFTRAAIDDDRFVRTEPLGSTATSSAVLPPP